jgi:hypothetical protein
MKAISTTERRMCWEDDNESWTGGGHGVFEGTSIIHQDRLWDIMRASDINQAEIRSRYLWNNYRPNLSHGVTKVLWNKPSNQKTARGASWYIGNNLDLYSGGPCSNLARVLLFLLRLLMIFFGLSRWISIKYLELACDHFLSNPNLLHYSLSSSYLIQYYKPL